MTFEERLIDLIKKSGLSHKEIAEKTSVSAGNVSNYRTGKVRPSFEAIIALANLFQVSTDYLLLGKPSEAPQESVISPDLPGLQQWVDLYLSVPPEARPYVLLSVRQYIQQAQSDAAALKKSSTSTAGKEDAATFDTSHIA